MAFVAFFPRWIGRRVSCFCLRWEQMICWLSGLWLKSWRNPFGPLPCWRWPVSWGSWWAESWEYSYISFALSLRRWRFSCCYLAFLLIWVSFWGFLLSYHARSSREHITCFWRVKASWKTSGNSLSPFFASFRSFLRVLFGWSRFLWFFPGILTSHYWLECSGAEGLGVHWLSLWVHCSQLHWKSQF